MAEKPVDRLELELPDLGYWSGTATLGLTSIILFSFILGHIVGAAVLGLFVDVRVADLFRGEGASFLATGIVDVDMLLYWVGASIALAIMIRFVRQRASATTPAHLGLMPLRLLQILPWLGVLVVFYGLFVALPEFTMARDGWNFGPLGGGTFLYFVTAVTIVPIFEESLFRGFMFAGLVQSRIRLVGAILLTNVLWTAVHWQPAVEWFNEIYGLGVIFGAGLVFTVARIRTGSIVAPIILHAVWNAALLLLDVSVWSKM